jgi:hypothetical protein
MQHRVIQLAKTDSIDIAPLKENGKLEDSHIWTANILNKQFSSVFTTDHPPDFPHHTICECELKHPNISIRITTEGVTKLLADTNLHKAMGPDGIQPRVLKQLAPAIAPILQTIFQKQWT